MEQGEDTSHEEGATDSTAPSQKGRHLNESNGDARGQFDKFITCSFMASASRLKDIVSTNKDRIAYAVGLLKSKPEQLSARGMYLTLWPAPPVQYLTYLEYLRILKQHEAKGRRDHALSSTYSHLDRSSYWRSECLREAEEKATLKQELDDLNLEHDRLKTKLELMSPVKKRKKVDEDVVPVPRSPKKSTNDISTNKKEAGTDEAISNFDFTSIGEAGKSNCTHSHGGEANGPQATFSCEASIKSMPF